MKLSILLAGSILTSAIVGNVYAQTCGAQPSCSDLGITCLQRRAVWERPSNARLKTNTTA